MLDLEPVNIYVIPKSLLTVCDVLRAGGFQAWIVGGAVRDLIMDRPVHDWDLSTDARPEQVQKLFARTLPTGIKHGTVTVFAPCIDWQGADYLTQIDHGKWDQYEVTTFRSDSDYSDGRHPDSVNFVRTIEEDLARRDFTMNAIAWDPVEELLFDPFGGGDDIRAKTIRCVGQPVARFSEDGLRCLRAIRFSAQLGFAIDDFASKAIRECLDSFRKVSPERVTSEWMKILESEYCDVSFYYMYTSGLLHETVPEIEALDGCSQNRYHAYDCWKHTLEVLHWCPRDPVVRLAALFHDIAKPQCKGVHPVHGDTTFYEHEERGAELTYEILTRMRFPNEIRDRVCHLIRHHLVMYDPKWSNATIRRWIRKIGVDAVPQVLALYRADLLGKGPAKVPSSTDGLDQLEMRIAGMGGANNLPTKTVDLAINGQDVMNALGIEPGKRVGEVLRQLLERVTDCPELNNRETLLELLNQDSVLR